jgi:hypothetical protein
MPLLLRQTIGKFWDYLKYFSHFTWKNKKVYSLSTFIDPAWIIQHSDINCVWKHRNPSNSSWKWRKSHIFMSFISINIIPWWLHLLYYSMYAVWYEIALMVNTCGEFLFFIFVPFRHMGKLQTLFSLLLVNVWVIFTCSRSLSV